MFRSQYVSMWMLALIASLTPSISHSQENAPSETKIDGPGGLPIIVRMQGPYDANVQLQIVCYFEKTQTSDSKLFGAPIELDNRLRGLIASLRNRGEFRGETLESLLVKPQAGLIKPKQLLLIGLGNPSELSLQRMESVGRAALREAIRIGAQQVAFAPLIKDAGNDSFPAGDVENSVVRGMLLAYDTEKRLQNQGLAEPFRLNTWVVEAGPMYYDDTIAGVRNAVNQATQQIDQRESSEYMRQPK